jgi:hypothetical protein
MNLVFYYQMLQDRQYDNYAIIGDLNFNVLNNDRRNCDYTCPLQNLCNDYNLKNIIKQPTFYHRNGNSLIDVLITNQCRKFLTSGVIDNDLSDGHSLIYGILRSKCPKLSPVDIKYRSFKTFNEEAFLSDLRAVPFSVVCTFDDPGDSLWICSKLLTDIVNDHAPWKKKRIRNKQPAFFNSKLKKAIMNKRRLLRKHKKSQLAQIGMLSENSAICALIFDANQ